MNKGIAIAGNLIVDHVKMVDNYPQAGLLTNIRDTSVCIGGCAGNTICDLAIIDPSLKLFCIGKTGSDSDAEYIKDILSRLGVNTKHIKSCDAPTSYTDVMTSLENNQRTFFHARGANARFSIDDIPFDELDVDIFHIGYALLLDEFDKEDPEYDTVMARALDRVQKKGIKTSIDVVSENSDRFVKIVTPALKYCNYVIINEVEASCITGIKVRDDNNKIINEKVNEAIKVIFSMGVKDVVCVHCPEGGWYGTPDGKIYFFASHNLPKGYIKGTVGAGDAFCAGMLYSLYKGFDPEKSLLVATCAAESNLSEKNSIDGLRPYDELLKIHELYKNN